MILRTICFFILFHLVWDLYSQEILDSAYLTCQYELLYSRDTLQPKLRDDLLILQIGKNVSKCYSYYTYQVDSIRSLPNWRDVFMKFFNNPATSVKSGKYPHKRMRTLVYKNYPHGKMTVTDGISLQDFIYVDEMGTQEWSIKKDTSRMIIGYRCQKAECNFRGRNYVAWFAPDIPINDGPWKFTGLPGLIMEIYDKGKQYQFSITGIEKSNEPIVFSKTTLQNGKYSKTKREKFLKAKKQYLMNVGGYIEAETGIDLGSDAKVMCYDLIERDY